MFDVTKWVARLSREDGTRGLPSQGVLASQVAPEICSVTGYPPCLVRDHISSHRMVPKPQVLRHSS